MPIPVSEDSPFSPPYRSDSYIEHPLIVLHDHRRLELSREVRTIHQDALVQLLDQVNVCPEPVPFIVSSDCPPSDNIIIRSERIHAILQLLAHIRDSTYQTILKQFYKKHGSTNHRAVAKDLYANSHFPPAFVQYQSLLTCLSCDVCQKMTAQQLHNHTVDLLEKLAVTCIRAGWLIDAEKFANRALKHEPCSTRARLWLATALMGLGNLDLARAHLALLPQLGSFPANFPKWIEQRVGMQRAMLRRLEDEQRGDYNVVAMARERRDRVPEVVRMSGVFGVQLGPQGWRTIVKLRKGAVVIVAAPIACAPCYIEDEEVCTELHLNETNSKTASSSVNTNTNISVIGNDTKRMSTAPTVNASGHVFGTIVLNSPTPDASTSKPKSTPTSPQSTKSISSPATVSTPSPAPKINLSSSSSTPLLDLFLDDTFALALAAENIFTEAAEKAELHAREHQKDKTQLRLLPQPKPKPDPASMILRTPPNAFLPRPVKRFKVPTVPPPLSTAPRLRSPLSKYSYAFDAPQVSTSVPTTHTTEDPPLLSLALLTDTLLNAAKTLPNIRAQVRTAAARCTRAAESVIDLVGEEVRAACMVVSCFYNVAIPFSDPESNGTGGNGDAKGKGTEKDNAKMKSFGGKNEYGTVHAGHGLYLPMFHLLSADGDNANTEVTFVGPYLFLRTTKDVEAGTLLSYAGFPGTIHPPRQHAVERTRKVGLTKRPATPKATTVAASSDGGHGADVSIVSGGGGFADTSKVHGSVVSPGISINRHDQHDVRGGPSSDVGFENTMNTSAPTKPSIMITDTHGFAVTPETSKGGSRGHSDF